MEHTYVIKVKKKKTGQDCEQQWKHLGKWSKRKRK